MDPIPNEPFYESYSCNGWLDARARVNDSLAKPVLIVAVQFACQGDGATTARIR